VAARALDRYPTIHVLVNNAGAVYGTRRLSPDGIELTWAVNHLAPFLLTTLLLERLEASAPARIVTTSSAAHQGARIPFDVMSAERSWGSSGFRRYGETKLANVISPWNWRGAWRAPASPPTLFIRDSWRVPSIETTGR